MRKLIYSPASSLRTLAQKFPANLMRLGMIKADEVILEIAELTGTLDFELTSVTVENAYQAAYEVPFGSRE